eukprot:scaffold72835_cov26-Tisochrysis_lutea.AAC.1
MKRGPQGNKRIELSGSSSLRGPGNGAHMQNLYFRGTAKVSSIFLMAMQLSILARGSHGSRSLDYDE